MKNIQEALNSFWKWANISELEYAACECKEKNIDEYFFPFWDILLNYAKHEFNLCMVSFHLNDALTIMGLDNETEDILDFCKTLSMDKKIFIAKIGANHLQSETRWQIAELLGTVDSEESRQILQKLSNDSNWYVKKRALNKLNDLNG